MSPGKGSAVPTNDDEAGEPEFVEKDPTGRYVRFGEVLGKGAFKSVYRAFDEVNGIEVAWNRVKISDVLRSPEGLEKLYSEVNLLKKLKHENIIKLYDSWVDDKKKTVNMITELFTSGNLREYRKKHRNVDMKAVKNWARQILRGLAYLHSHDPPVIHRDLKCDNIFINGNHGEVKIGDLGLATVMQQPTAHSVIGEALSFVSPSLDTEKSFFDLFCVLIIGTPEFMAPELYEEDYNELADIYSFGMCMLEMVTFEYPYSECKNPAQIFKKVTSGIKPASLAKVKDLRMKEFIEKCLVPVSERLPAKELLKDSFLQVESPKEPIHHPIVMPSQPPRSTASTSTSHSIDLNADHCKLNYWSNSSGNSCISPTDQVLEFTRAHMGNLFQLRGKKNHDDSSISLTLRIVYPSGEVKKIDFVFYLEFDTAIALAAEMVAMQDLADYDMEFTAEFIDYLIKKITMNSKPSSVHSSVEPDKRGDDTMVENIRDTGMDDVFAEDSSGILGKALQSLDYCIDDCYKRLSVNKPEMDIGESHSEEHKISRINSHLSGCTHLNEMTKNSEGATSMDHGGISGLTSLASSSSSSLNEEEDDELKADLASIETQYQHWFEELARMREEALEAAKKKWMMKKKMVALSV
ncbi:probable serine/threonine-protein kinase WNK10 isoform X2 [Chenopodium quinoa]|uniref:probable serine/threonine-protein kinase WNK10 isoform X2 n=1 Tax=Chenopodium quinoa TaxID=63459 RepID=UPI000B773ABA|nr:probable serine/threonine-protein kinase WNK10 isoform X2 [Chenopodium quinoa]